MIDDFSKSHHRDRSIDSDASPRKKGPAIVGLSTKVNQITARDPNDGEPTDAIEGRRLPQGKRWVTYDPTADAASSSGGATVQRGSPGERIALPAMVIHADRAQDPVRGRYPQTPVGGQLQTKNLSTPIHQIEKDDPGKPGIAVSGPISDLLRAIDEAAALVGADAAETHPDDLGTDGLTGGGNLAWAPALGSAKVSVRTRIGDTWAPMKLGPPIETDTSSNGAAGTSVRESKKKGGSGGDGGAGGDGGGFQAGRAKNPNDQARLDQAVSSLNRHINDAAKAYQTTKDLQSGIQTAKGILSTLLTQSPNAEFSTDPLERELYRAAVANLAGARDDLASAQSDYQIALRLAQVVASQLSLDPGTIQLGIQNYTQASIDGQPIGLVSDGSGGYTLAFSFGLGLDASGHTPGQNTGALLNDTVDQFGQETFSVFGGGYGAGGLNIDVPTAFFGAGVNIPQYQKVELAKIFAVPAVAQQNAEAAYRALLAILKHRPDVLQSTDESVMVNEQGQIPQRILDAWKAAGGAGGNGGAGNEPPADTQMTGVRLSTLFGDYGGFGWPIAWDDPVGEPSHDHVYAGAQWSVGYPKRIGKKWRIVSPIPQQVPPGGGGDGNSDPPPTGKCDPTGGPLPPGVPRGGGKTFTPQDTPQDGKTTNPDDFGDGGGGDTTPRDGGKTKNSGDGGQIPCDTPAGKTSVVDASSKVNSSQTFAASATTMGSTAAQKSWSAGKTAISDEIERPVAYKRGMDQRARLGGGPIMTAIAGRVAPLVPPGGPRLADPFDVNRAMSYSNVIAGEINRLNQVVSLINERFQFGANAVLHAGLKLPTQRDPAKVRLELMDVGTIIMVGRPASLASSATSQDRVAQPHIIALDPRTRRKILKPLGDFIPDRMQGRGIGGESILQRFDTGFPEHANLVNKPHIGWDGANKTLKMRGADTEIDQPKFYAATGKAIENIDANGATTWPIDTGTTKFRRVVTGDALLAQSVDANGTATTETTIDATSGLTLKRKLRVKSSTAFYHEIGGTPTANRTTTLGDFDTTESKTGGSEGLVAVTDSSHRLGRSFVPYAYLSNDPRKLTMTTDISLSPSSTGTDDAEFQFLDPNGSDRIVTINSESNEGVGPVLIQHIGTANTITIRDVDLTTKYVLSAKEAVWMVADGSMTGGWRAVPFLPSSGALGVARGGTGLTAQGTQYQTFQAGASTPAFDAVHLDQAAAVTGTLPVGNGGTGSAVSPLYGQAPMSNSGGTAYAPGYLVLTRSIAGTLLLDTDFCLRLERYVKIPAVGIVQVNAGGSLTITNGNAGSAAAG